MISGLRAFAPLLLITFILATPALGEAQGSENDARARELYLRGDRLYNEGRYEDAVGAFQESYRLSGRALLLFNLANAYERLGRYEEALDALRRYAPEAPVEEEDQIRARLQALSRRAEEQAAREGVGRQEPADEPPEEDETSVAAVGADPEPPPPAGGPDVGLMAAGGAIAGVGVVLVVTGAIFGVQALDARTEAESSCGELGELRLCGAEARETLDREANFALLADLGITIGSAAAVAGVVMLVLGLTTESGAETASALRPVLGVSPSGGEVGLAGAF